MKSRAEIFLKDMTYNSRFEILEESKDKNELKEIASKRGIKLPAHDLMVFKCTYAYIDRMNKNGCVLPKEEVEKSLDTLVGKAVDFDHLRKRVVGTWLDAKIDGEEIIAYGSFYKGNFPEDFEIIQGLMKDGVLAISFEAWGNRDFDQANEGYSLRDIEFAGGALLIKTEPAFDGAKVIETAKKNKILELAKVMRAPEEFVHLEKAKEKKSRENSKFSVWDMDTIHRVIAEVPNGDGETKGLFEILMMDFESNKVRAKDLTTEDEVMIELTPKVVNSSRNISKIEDLSGSEDIEDINDFIKSFKGSDSKLEILVEKAMNGPRISNTERLELTDEDFAVVKNIKTENGNKKIRIFPILTLAHIKNVEDKLNQENVISMLNALDIQKNSVEGKLFRRANKIKMKTFIEKLKDSSLEEVIQELANACLGRDLTEKELEGAYSIVEISPGGSDSNDTSLLKVPQKKSTGSPQSLVNASITEDKMKEAIKEAVEKASGPEKESVDDVLEKLSKLMNVSSEDLRNRIEASKKEDKDSEIAELKKKLDEANSLISKYKEQERACKVKDRKDLLGEFAKDMSDDDVLDDFKFELAKRDKVIAELKGGKQVSLDFSKGSDDKTLETAEKESRRRVDTYAFGEENKSEG